MKVHDRLVVEISEIIKGYGNNPNTKEPLNLPRDYKFYEIEGLALSEETVKKMKPLEEVEQEDLDHVYKEGYKAGYARAMLDYGLED